MLRNNLREIKKEYIFQLLCLTLGVIWFLANITGIDRYIATIVIVMGVMIFSFAMGKEKLRAQMQYLDLYCLGMYILLFSINENSLFVEDAHKIFFAVLSASVIVICRKYKDVIPKKEISKKYIFLKLTFAVIIAGQFEGYRIFWLDSKLHVGFSELVCFILFIYWALFLLTTSEILMFKLGEGNYHEVQNAVKNKKRIVHIITFLLIWIVGIIMSYIFYPGIYSWDTSIIYLDALDISDVASRSDIHSFFYVIIFSIFGKFTTSLYPITLFFLTIFALVVSAFLTYLYRQGIKEKIIYIISICIVIFPNNLYMMISLWKDVPFTISLISLTHAVTKIVVEGEEFTKSKLNVIHLMLSIICTALLRSNGLMVLPLVLACFFCFFKRKIISIKCLVITILAVVVVGVIKGPIYKSFSVQGTPEYFASMPFIDGIWTNLYLGNELTPETEEYMYSIIPNNEWIDNYRHGFFNQRAYIDYTDRIYLRKSVKGWFECLWDHPATTLSSRLMKTDMIWSIFQNEGAVLGYSADFAASHISVHDSAKVFGWSWREQTFNARIAFQNYFNWFHNNLAVFYRGGWNLMIWLLLIFNGIVYRNRKVIATFLPCLGSTIALLIASCYGDYRYIWYMFLATPFLICVYIILQKNNDITS